MCNEKHLGNIANLPKATQEDMVPAGDFANELILGAYLKKIK